MSWLDTLTELTGSGGGAGPGASYIRGQVITQAVREGASGNQILDALGNAGLGIRRDQGQALISAERARQMAGRTSLQIDPSLTPVDLLSATAPDRWTGQFVHQVAVIYRTKDEEGNYILHTRTLGIKSRTLLSPADAFAAATQIMTSSIPSEEEGEYPLPSDILSGSLSGVWYDTQNRNLPAA